ncbi:MAG: endonuclease domain-containing protein [Clostridia bacterium]|nr:endonuclease domain-containing protein [Clostridia bacterium]
MRLPYKKTLIPFAKNLRKNATPQENHLWYDFLHDFHPRFQRQKVIDGYIADFYCEKAGLVIELDGSQHFTVEGITYDEARTRILNAYGLTVLRFTNHDIDTHFPAVCQQIQTAVHQRLEHRKEESP